ncbi:hypothetical protein SDC9_130081 [bioreactor metagenome]|uniref:DNA alkylation repair enzyme n=1 Tax=bioreactor metagenome TaxID=1076179 RepID=A0A645D1S9_9ZZZZ
MAISHYMKIDYCQRVFAEIDQIKQTDYYVKMAIAWALSVYYINFPQPTISYLQSCQLSPEIIQKTIQKICDSHRIAADKKIELRMISRNLTAARETEEHSPIV